MIRTVLRWVLLGILGFAIVVLVRLPARWAGRLLPPGVQCASLGGTLWRGDCARLSLTAGTTAGALQIERLSWRLRPLSLLRGRLAADIEIAHRGGSATGSILATAGGAISADALSGELQVDHSLVAMLPQGWQGELGAVELGFASRDARLDSIRGTLRLLNLQDARGAAFGSFEVQFGDAPQRPPVHGQLRDLGGPLGVTGTLRIEANGAWQIDGRLTPRADASAGLVRRIRALGLPDAAGSYPFSIAGEAKR